MPKHNHAQISNSPPNGVTSTSNLEPKNTK